MEQFKWFLTYLVIMIIAVNLVVWIFPPENRDLLPTNIGQTIFAVTIGFAAFYYGVSKKKKLSKK